MSWTVDVDGAPNQSANAAVAVAIGDRMYCFGDFVSPGLNMTGPMDVQIIQADGYRWSVLKYPNSNSDEIPCRLYGHSAVVHKDLVYIWGGSSNDEAFNDLYCFDTNTHLWSKPIVKGTLPAPRVGHSACVFDDSMYIFGGFEEHSPSEESSPQFYQDVHKLDLNSMKWSCVQTTGLPPTYRYKHSATIINNCMFIFSGLGYLGLPDYIDEEIYCNEIIYLDMKTLNWIRPKINGLYHPEGRGGHVSFSYKGQLFIFGGCNSIHGKYYNDLVRYNPDSCCWSVVETRGNGPSPRDKPCCCIIGDRVFLYGGLSPVPSITEEDFANLVDQQDLHVLDFAPTLKTMAIMAVLEHKLNQKCLPETIRSDIKAMTRQHRF